MRTLSLKLAVLGLAVALLPASASAQVVVIPKECSAAQYNPTPASRREWEACHRLRNSAQTLLADVAAVAANPPPASPTPQINVTINGVAVQPTVSTTLSGSTTITVPANDDSLSPGAVRATTPANVNISFDVQVAAPPPPPPAPPPVVKNYNFYYQQPACWTEYRWVPHWVAGPFGWVDEGYEVPYRACP